MISFTKVRELLKSALFNPKKDPAMKIIAESLSPEYYECRAIELIKEAKMVRYSDEYDSKMNMAMRLIVLARHHGAKKDTNGEAS